MKTRFIFTTLLLITLSASAIKTQDELKVMWRQSVPELSDKVMNRLIAVFPQVQNEVANPVTWTRQGDNFKAVLPIMEEPGQLVINPDGLIIHSERKISQYYLPANIKAAIIELCPTYNPVGNFSSPISSIYQIIDSSTGQGWYNLFATGVGCTYKITFDNGMTSEMLKNTQAYKTVSVNQYGVIL